MIYNFESENVSVISKEEKYKTFKNENRIKTTLNSICLIEIDNTFGTGFFIKIPIPSKKYPLLGLMTNNHVLNEKIFESRKSFKIYKFNNKEQAIEIQINYNEDFVFTSELIDITFIELNDEIVDEIEPEFLNPSKEEDEIGQSILILQYPKTQESFAHGRINSDHGFNYFHEILTDQGSSGSPLLNERQKVIGVHKSKLKEEKENNKYEYINIATKYSEIEFAIKILYNNKNIYGERGMKRARKSARMLTDDEINKLKEYGLQKKIDKSSDEIEKEKNDIEKIENENEKELRLKELENSEILRKSLFYCTFSKKLLFYRTNYAWYITKLSKKKNNYISEDEYTLDKVKFLDWTPILHYNLKRRKIENVKSNIEYNLKCILIKWLILTELKYL